MILSISYIHYYWIAFWDVVLNTVEVEVVYIQGFLLILDPRAC